MERLRSLSWMGPLTGPFWVESSVCSGRRPPIAHEKLSNLKLSSLKMTPKVLDDPIVCAFL